MTALRGAYDSTSYALLCTLSRSTLALWGMSMYILENLGKATDLFVARIFGAEDIHTALSTHYVAAVAHDFDGRPNLHASTEGYWGWWGDMMEMGG